MKTYFVYIMASASRTLYIGVTGDLSRRVYEHKHTLIAGFTAKYHVDRLVYIEQFTDARAAIAREKQLKGWTRAKKIALVESVNPGWADLSETSAQTDADPSHSLRMTVSPTDADRAHSLRMTVSPTDADRAHSLRMTI